MKSAKRPMPRTYHLNYSPIAAAIRALAITSINDVPYQLFNKSLGIDAGKKRGGGVKANARKAYKIRARKRAKRNGQR